MRGDRSILIPATPRLLALSLPSPRPCLPLIPRLRSSRVSPASPLRLARITNATVAPPDCAFYPRDGGGGHCGSYADNCSLHVIAGQVWTRRITYELIIAHEGRTGRHFDSVLLARPDVALMLPSLPWCLQPLHVARNLHECVPDGRTATALVPH